jgi:hypothetical protein
MCNIYSHKHSVIVEKVECKHVTLNKTYDFQGKDVISPLGQLEIIRYCRIMLDKQYDENDTIFIDRHYPYYDLFQHVGDETTTLKGKFTNRLSKYLKDCFGYKMSNDDKAHVGNMVNIHRTPKQSYSLVFSDDLWIWDCDNYELTTNDNGSSSCYRPGGCYHNAFQAIMNSPDYVVLKVFNGDNDFIGRAWVRIDHDSLIIFNAYGVQLRNIGAMLSDIFPHLKQNDTEIESSILYVNGGGSALILTDNEIKLNKGYFYLNPDEVLTLQCSQCGEWEDEDDYSGTYVGNAYICQDCLDSDFIYCENCGEYSPASGSVYHNDRMYCEDCAHSELSYCAECEEVMNEDDCYYIEHDSITICSYCYDRHNYGRCEHCENDFHPTDLITTNDGLAYCHDCAIDHVSHCANCDDPIDDNGSYHVGHVALCFTCWDNANRPTQMSLLTDEMIAQL